MSTAPPPALKPRIDAILADPRFDAEEASSSREDAIFALVDPFGWEAVRDEVLSILEDDGRQAHWYTAMVVLWYAIDHHPMPADRVIGLLQYCLLQDLPEPLDENLVWSITRNLKKVEYLSDYDPLQDPGVLAELERRKAMRVL